MSVLLEISYKTFLTIGGLTYNSKFSSFCGGTLIDRKTVLTAGHCIIKSYPFEINGTIYDVNITSNEFHHSYESIFTVYVGAHSLVSDGSEVTYTKPHFVKKAIVVTLYFLKSLSHFLFM